MISIIVAIAQNNAIGKDNKLLWHLPEDLKRFKELTTGNTIIMGKKTFYSLPKRPLPNRTNIVITDIKDEVIEGCVMAYSIDDAISKCDKDKENFVIGGASIYEQFLDKADKLYITYVYKSFDGDCFFPQINYCNWKRIAGEFFNGDEFDYEYIIYEKNNLNVEYSDIIKNCKFISKSNEWFLEGTEVKCVDGYSYSSYKEGDKFNAGWSLFEGYTNEAFEGFHGELPRLDGETCAFDEFYIYDEFGNEISELTLTEYKKLIYKDKKT